MGAQKNPNSNCSKLVKKLIEFHDKIITNVQNYRIGLS